jgi:NADH:ubiquinone oxidoreductase subunit 4 (subunit M)
LFNRVVFGTFKTKYLRVLPKADAAAALDFELDSDVAKRRGDINRRETAILGILLIAMLVLGVSANFILTVLHAPVALLLLP